MRRSATQPKHHENAHHLARLRFSAYFIRCFCIRSNRRQKSKAFTNRRIYDQRIQNSVQNAVITLRDAKKNVLHEEVMTKKSEKFDGRFDVSNLKDGDYTLEIVSGNEKIEKQVSIKSSKEEVSLQRSVQLNK